MDKDGVHNAENISKNDHVMSYGVVVWAFDTVFIIHNQSSFPEMRSCLTIAEPQTRVQLYYISSCLLLQ